MIYFSLPDNATRRLSFYLAMEEYVAREKSWEDAFTMWQVEPSVIFGRNQVVEAEVNIDYCRRNNIQMYRRKSGGGCVYADMSNVMFAYITSEDNVNFTYNRYINMVVTVLRKMGIEATSSGRNDILIDGRKVSGNAFYHLPGRSIVHGTMLYDTNMQHMVASITPSDDKLVSKGIQSVRQRIAFLKDYTSLSINEMKSFVRENLCTEEVMLTADDVRNIEVLEQEYLDPNFIFGTNPLYSVVRKRRLEGIGELELRMEVKGNRVRHLNLLGDFFVIGDLNRLLQRIQGCELTEAALSQAIPDDIDMVIRGLHKQQLIDLLVNR
ncbi:MAG: lipoate--protein ligase [Prevotella sp.]|nr:lipoate--protein ligase [Prevotella sp.]